MNPFVNGRVNSASKLKTQQGLMKARMAARTPLSIASPLASPEPNPNLNLSPNSSPNPNPTFDLIPNPSGSSPNLAPSSTLIAKEAMGDVPAGQEGGGEAPVSPIQSALAIVEKPLAVVVSQTGEGSEEKNEKWEDHESLILVELKKNEHYEDVRDGIKVKKKPAVERWGKISAQLLAEGVVKSGEQCKNKWMAIQRQYKDIKDFKDSEQSGGKSYWIMDSKERKQHKLPSAFDLKVYCALDSWMASKATMNTPLLQDSPAPQRAKQEVNNDFLRPLKGMDGEPSPAERGRKRGRDKAEFEGMKDTFLKMMKDACESINAEQRALHEDNKQMVMGLATQILGFGKEVLEKLNRSKKRVKCTKPE